MTKYDCSCVLMSKSCALRYSDLLLSVYLSGLQIIFTHIFLVRHCVDAFFLFFFLLFSYLRFLLPVTYFVNLRLIVSHFDSRHSNTGFTLSLFTVGSSWFLSEFPATGVRCCLAFATLQ